jgi:hypothetical protein
MSNTFRAECSSMLNIKILKGNHTNELKANFHRYLRGVSQHLSNCSATVFYYVHSGREEREGNQSKREIPPLLS